MTEEFFRAVAANAGLTLHLAVEYGRNDHHKTEALYKAFARCLRAAAEVRGTEIPSTKGVL
jgi:imidazoleglycerol-phosphate dehydratase